MNGQELLCILKTTGIPFARHHWERPPKPPYGVYLYDETNNFYADDRVYFVAEGITLELYTVDCSRMLLKRLEDALDQAEIIWDRDSEYLPDLRLFQTNYEIEV